MPENGESAPLLRGRPGGGHQSGGALLPRQAGGAHPEADHAGDGSRFVSRRLPAVLLKRARSHGLLLAVAAVGAAVLVIGAGMRSTSEQGISRGGGDVSLAAAPAGGSDAARDGGSEAAAAAAALDLVGRRDGGGVVVGGTGKGGGSRVPSGGWRSQSERAPGTTQSQPRPSVAGWMPE